MVELMVHMDNDNLIGHHSTELMISLRVVVTYAEAKKKVMYIKRVGNAMLQLDAKVFTCFHAVLNVKTLKTDIHCKTNQ
jgi:hypothetical protein